MSGTYPAMLNDYELSIKSISDDYEFGIVKKNIINRNGPKLQKTGLVSRTIQFISVWANDNYENHKAFLKDLLTLDEWELSHPNYGTLKGQVTNASVAHDDGIDYCEIQISFIEGESKESNYVVLPAIDKQQEQQFLKVMAVQKEEIKADFNGLPNYSKIQLQTIKAKYDFLMSNVLVPDSSIISLIEFSNDFPNSFLKSTCDLVERTVTYVNSVESSPELLLNNTWVQIKKLYAGLKGIPLKHMLLMCASRLSLQAGYAYAEDERQRVKYRRLEAQSVFDKNGNFVVPETLPEIMNVQSVERSLSNSREMVQQAINLRSATDSSKILNDFAELKTMSKNLLDHVSKIKIEMDKIVQVEIKNEMPLHLICLKYGLSYRYADRIMTINKIKNPTFVKGVINLYAR